MSTYLCQVVGWDGLSREKLRRDSTNTTVRLKKQVLREKVTVSFWWENGVNRMILYKVDKTLRRSS